MLQQTSTSLTHSVGHVASRAPAPPARRARRHRVPAATQQQQKQQHEAQEDPTSHISTTRRRLLSLAGCACCLQALQQAASTPPPAAASEGGPPFSYAEGSEGPSRWPGTCSSGSQQSPINLSLTTQTACDTRPPPVFKYRASTNLAVKNTGTTLQVNFAEGSSSSSSSSSWAGQQLQLLQYHFHTPSEHTVEGSHTAMEAHLVHRNLATGGLTVLAVLLEAPPAGQQPQPPPNPCLAAGLAAVPDTPGASAVCAGPINPSDLLPQGASALQRYVSYRGSLTTPPCSEGVDWLVWTQPLQVPQQQVAQFRRFAGGMNARPLQPLNSRAVAAGSCLATS